jgi:hypothetical protein
MKYLVFVERENVGKDLSFMRAMEDALAGTGYKLIFYRSTRHDLFASLDPEGKLHELPAWLGGLLRKIIVILHPSQWHHYRNESIAKRSRRLKDYALKLKSQGNEVSVIGRSAGARLAALVADVAGIDKLVCLGYPFRHPDPNIGDEPERYRHLANLRTPTLIIQGGRDIYGGLEVRDKYSFSPAITLEFLDTDHDFSLSAADWEKMISTVKNFLK